MKTCIVTSAAGLVAPYLLDYFSSSTFVDKVICIDSVKPEVRSWPGRLDFNSRLINLLDLAAVEDLVKTSKPDLIIHLASFSSVAASWQRPKESGFTDPQFTG